MGGSLEGTCTENMQTLQKVPQGDLNSEPSASAKNMGLQNIHVIEMPSSAAPHVQLV